MARGMANMGGLGGVGGMGGGGGQLGAWQMMRTFRRDDSVKNSQVPKGTVKRIVNFGKPYTKILSLYLFLIILSAVASAASPLIYRAIIDDGIARHDSRVIIGWAIVAGVLAIVSAGLTLWQRYVSAVVGEGLIYDMRSKVFAHIQRMPLAFFTRTQTGALVSRLNNDILDAQSAFTNLFSSVIGNFVTVIIILAAMFTLSWEITLVAVALLPLFIIPARWIGKKIQIITRESYNLNAKMTNTMTERFNVSGALLMMLFGNPSKESHLFNGRAGRVRDIGVSQAMYTASFLVALLTVASLATAIVYGWGGVLAVHSILEIGTVVALGTYLTRLYAPLTSLSNVQIDLMTALVSFDRIFEVLDLEPMVKDKPGAVDILPGPAKVEFSHVDFHYPRADEVSLASLESVATLDQTPNNQVLNDVSFVAEPGQMVALVGPSGAGKTTISHLIPRLYDPDSGSVTISGTDLKDATLSSVRQRVGVVTQDAHLFHETIRENLAYAKEDATDEEMLKALEAAQIINLVQSLPEGLDTVVGDRGYRLSGGEKQRIALARLLLKAPDVVVLDEATAHLDSESELAVQKALSKALEHRTSIVIAHRLSTIKQADKIIVVNGGRVVETGRHEELLKLGGLYAELYMTQFATQEEASISQEPTLEQL
jgi:ATP-binding cassette subfamily B protein